MTKFPVFLNEETHYPEREREVKKEYLYFIWEAVPLITERLTNN